MPNYNTVKVAIHAQYGLSLPSWAQRVHDWSYDLAVPFLAQVTTLICYTKSLLEEAAGPPIVDRVVIDRCLPGTAK